jgi:hypothetical protein
MAETPAEAGASETDLGAGLDRLRDALAPRGWRFKVLKGTIRARLQDWPAQVEVLIDPGSDGLPSRLGVLLDFRSMPLGGERLRDIFNADREGILGRYGSFFLRQVRSDGAWAGEVTHGAFLQGFGSASGISRQTQIALFDRSLKLRGDELIDNFIEDIARFAEAGNQVAATLQRVYQRTVLTGHTLQIELPGDTPPPDAGEPSYPWRR